jgi:hypothetical protein
MGSIFLMDAYHPYVLQYMTLMDGLKCVMLTTDYCNNTATVQQCKVTWENVTHTASLTITFYVLVI